MVEARRKIKEVGRIGILRQIRVILVGQRSPQRIHSDIFTPFQAVEQRDAIEDFPIQIPRAYKRDIAVVHKLHVLDEVEHPIFFHKRGVRPRHTEQRESHTVPLRTGFEMGFDLAPRPHPPALVDAHFRVVVGVVTPRPFQSHGVRDAEDGCIAVGTDAALFGIDIGSAGLIFKQQTEVGHRDVAHIARCRIKPCRHVRSRTQRPPHTCCRPYGYRLIEEVGSRFVAVVRQLGFDAQAILPLAFKEEAEVFVVHHVIDLRPFRRQKHVVFVGG